MSYLEDLLKNIRNLEHMIDLVLVAGKDGRKIFAHRTVVEAVCSKFHSLIVDDSFPYRITVPDIDGDLLQTTIDYIYSGHIELTPINANDFVYVASVLGIFPLQQKCVQFLVDNLSYRNCISTLSVATNCENFELFAKSFKFTIENFAHLPRFVVPLFPTPEQTESNTRCIIDVICSHILQCFERMETNHVELISSALESIHLGKVPKKFLGDVLAPLLAKHNLTNILLDEYGRRSINPPAPEPFTLPSSRTPVTGDICCTFYSQSRNSLIVQKYNSFSNGWEEVKSLSCVSACIQYVYTNRKLFVIADQDRIRIVESYELDSNKRSVCSRIMPWRAGFKAIAAGDFIYVIGGVGWHADSRTDSPIGTLDRLYTNSWDKSNIWKTCEPMPVWKIRFVTAELDGRIYVAGGDNNGQYSDEFFCYDTETNTWTEKARIQLRSTNAILFKMNKFLYAISPESILHKYDPEEDGWTMIGPFRGGGAITDTTEYRDKTYAICREGRFGIIEKSDAGGSFIPLADITGDFDAFNPPKLFVN